MHQRRKHPAAEEVHAHEREKEEQKPRNSISIRFVLVWLAMLLGFAAWRHTWLPEPKGKDIPASEFSEARARTFLEELQAIPGFRTVGSYSNEVATPAWLLNHLKSFQERCTSPCQLEIDVQKPTGAFGLDFLSQFQNIYANVSNVLVRVQRETHTAETPAILISSHYDAAAGAGAASDDGVNIAIMLELLQNLISSDLPLHNGVIFNFNGGEETMLQAAHGFITQHPWKEQVAAFINLEAVGAGGRELLFQTGSDVLAMAYAQGAPYPHGSTVAQEVFESGVIPGITDFEVYSEHGDVAGMDFAYIANGYVYHTPLDDISRIQPGAIQRFGENIQGTLNVLFRHPEMVESIASKSESQGHIFFDVFGFFTITCTENIIGWINYLVVVLGATYCGIWSPLTLRQRWFGVWTLVKMSIAAIVAPLVVAAFLVQFAPMSWYALPTINGLVFIVPSILACITYFPYEEDALRLVQPLVEGLATIWMALSAVLMVAGIQSAYVSIMWVALPLFSYIIASSLNSRRAVIIAILIGTSVPYVYFVQLYIVVLQVFIPTMGRLGNLLPSDLVVSVLIALPTAVTLTNFAPLLCYAQPKSLQRFRTVLIVATAASLGVACLSPSYTEECPKRLGITHVYRNFSQVDLPDDWGLWFNSFDYRGLEPLRPTFEKTHWKTHLHPPADSVSPFKIFENFPWFYPIAHLIPAKYTWYLPSNPPNVQRIPTYVHVVSSTFDETTNLRKVHFFFRGPSHSNLYIDGSSTKLTSWSLGNGRDGVPPRVDDAYILQFASGSAESGYHFWIEAESNATMRIAYCGFYLDETTPDIQQVLDVLPSWTSQSHAIASWGILRV